MIILIFSISVILMVSLPVVFASLLRRRYRVPWIVFGFGTLTFAASQAVHLPLNHLLEEAGLLSRALQPGPDLIQSVVILGLTAGICEELARAAGYAILKNFRSFENSLMFGLGHGGIESMVLGGVLTAATVGSLWGLRGTDLQSLGLSPDQLSALTIQMEVFTGSAWLGFAPLFERLLAMIFHLILSVMVWKAFESRKAGYVVLAILYHTAVDAGAVWMTIQIKNSWAIEGIFVLMLIPGLFWLWRLWLRTENHPKSLPIKSFEGRIFISALRKEMLQLWKTKRFLILVLVFGLFGLMSPLMAYFMPQIIGSVQGAEAFANLIPQPTAADAMQQYVKNISQFGFILAVLLGMNAVAGEKESGTAELILSKPMPRWVFVSSKFAAQLLAYGAAFLIASVGGYFYTIVLFGGFPIGQFAAMNLLLLLWELTFVGITLLGSTAAKTTSAAAGFALGGCVLLLLLGNIPQVGMLLPSGLLAWAGQLGGFVDQANHATNFGAVTAAFVILLMSNLWAISIFEQQEL